MMETAKSKPTSFQFKWTSNGEIFVRKNKKSRSVKIVNEEMLNDLIAEQDCKLSNPATVSPDKMAESVPKIRAPPKCSAEPAPQFPPIISCTLPQAPYLPERQRFPPSPSHATPPVYVPTSLGSYANATNSAHKYFVPYTPYRQQTRTNFTNRNSLLSPNALMSMHQTLNQHYLSNNVRPRFPSGKYKSRAFSR